MSRENSTGVLALWYVPSIANIHAPTTTEINAGVSLTGWLTRDGLQTPQEGTTSDASDVSSAQNKTAPGSYGGQPITTKFHRDTDSGSDTAWATLPRGTSGFLVVRRFGGSTGSSDDAIATGQRVEVWPIKVNSRAMMDIADNETQKFTVQYVVPGEVDDDAVVA